MSYSLSIKPSAEREMRSLPPQMLRRIHRRIQRLAQDPHASGTVKLSGIPGYRARVGDYRIIFGIDDAGSMIEILAVRHRREAYR